MCNCQKQTTFSPKQFQLEGNADRIKMRKSFEGTVKRGMILSSPGWI